MNRLKNTLAALLLVLPLLSCASFNAYQKAREAEKMKDWDSAVVEYEKALQVDPSNMRFRISLQRAKLEASRVHFEKGKSLRTAAEQATGPERTRLAQLALTELQLTVRLDPTNQFAAEQMGKAIRMIQDQQAAERGETIDDIKRRAKITKAQPPSLNPASDDPISLSFPRETPVKDIYRALGNAFGINILFDQAVKDDRIVIELRDVTAQQALERVMQAANHFYKVLDEKTIIVVPDNPQARRDYEDLVIRTFYLSNGDAEQVTNVVRTMIEARNVFPLKALNAITIRDTADKVRIAEKIIEANDKAKSEVVVDVELLEMDADKTRDLGAFVSGLSGTLGPHTLNDKGEPVARVGTLADFQKLTSGSYTFTFPSVNYNFIKSIVNSETLANPELRISEGEKATLHIGRRVPVPVTTFTTGVQSGQLGNLPATSFQYQDVGIKVAIEPRVHHNREVTLKLTVEVSDIGGSQNIGGQDLPTFITRTIEATIRLKDGETNFLAGLIQQNNSDSDSKTPFLGDLPVLGRLFTRTRTTSIRTDLMLTMTPHIIRIPDITEEDLAPMWVGTQNNLTFRGVSPRIESQSGIDPFTTPRTTEQFGNAGAQLTPDGEPGNIIQRDPNGRPAPAATPMVPPGSAPNDPFRTPNPVPPTPQPQSDLGTQNNTAAAAAGAIVAENPMRLSPRISPQPVNLGIKPGEQKVWNLMGMDLDGLNANTLLLHYDARAIEVMDVSFGPALKFDPATPPMATVNREAGTIRITSTDGKPLAFNSGGELIALRVQGGLSGETFLVLENPDLRDAKGAVVLSAISGGRARVE